MAYYPQFPTFYAFPVPCPGPEFYAMYPVAMPVSGTNMMLYDQQQMDNFQPYIRPNRKSFDLRKISNVTIPNWYSFEMFPKNLEIFFFLSKKDSGIYSTSNPSSRKTSNTSTTSVTSVGEESVLDEEMFEKPDDYLSAEIVQQVKIRNLSFPRN